MKIRKQVFASIVPMLLVFLLASPSALTQTDESTATLDETPSFIKNSMEAWGEGEWGVATAKVQFLLLARCKAQIFETHDYSRRGQPNEYIREEFSLSDIDPLAVQIKDFGQSENKTYHRYYLEITAYNNKKLIHETQRFGNDSSYGRITW